MSLHAVGNVDDAIDATKAFLFPFELGKWLRLALVVFFIGGGGLGGLQNLGNLNNIGTDSGPGGTDGFGTSALTAPVDSLTSPGALLQVSEPQVPTEAVDALAGLSLVVILLAIIVLVAIALLFAVLGATMEFVFTQSLISTEVHLRRYLRTHFGNGLRLLVFRVLFGLVSLLVFGGILLGTLFTVTGGNLADVGPSVLLGSVGLFIIVLVAAALVSGTITGFTNVFVVPLMVQGDHGVLAGWGRLWSSMTDEPKQYLAYLFLSVVLAIGVSIVGTLLGAIALIVLAIPFGIVAAVLWFALGGGGLEAGIVVGVVALVFGLALLLVANLIKAPLQAFLRYYAMLVLGDIDADLDPIPEVRDSIRT